MRKNAKMYRIYLLHRQECEDDHSRGSFEELLLGVSLANQQPVQDEELYGIVEEVDFQTVHQIVS